MTKGPEYAVYAVRYAHKERRRPENFFNGDPHDAPMPMDYFVWAVVGGGRTWIVDTGFDKADAEARGRTLYRNAAEALALIDIDAAAVEDVIITHLHYDHVGGFAYFPAARFHLQDDEMAFATGRHMTSAVLNRAYTADHVANLVYEVYKGRVVFHAGDAELAPGLSVHHVGGHTKGLQVVRVRTRVGWLVLASDATHYYENMETCRPYATAYDLGAMVEAFRRLNELAESPDHIVPGHDPLVMERYPPVSDDLEGIAVRLDVERAG